MLSGPSTYCPGLAGVFSRIGIMLSMLLMLIAPAVMLQGQAINQEPQPVRRVALLPMVLKDGTDTAMKTARETVTTLFEKVNYEVVPPVRTKTIWEEELQMPTIKEVLEGKDSLPELPKPKDLLALGRKMGVQLVCAARADWHTKSVWVGLGPKTKADCTIDMLIIDVAKEEIVLDAKEVKADSTRKEKGLETAAALLVSAGFTVISGGPKTPHQQRSAQLAIGLAMEPWLKTQAQASRKIGG